MHPVQEQRLLESELDALSRTQEARLGQYLLISQYNIVKNELETYRYQDIRLFHQ